MIETIKNILSKLGLFNIVRTMVKKPFNSIRSYFFRKNVLKTFQKLLSILEPKNFIGFAPEQTEKFIDIEIKPILEKYKNLLGMDSELKV